LIDAAKKGDQKGKSMKVLRGVECWPVLGRGGGVQIPSSSGGHCSWKGIGGKFPKECSREEIGGVPPMAEQKVGSGRLQTQKRMEGKKRLDGPWPKESLFHGGYDKRSVDLGAQGA
jgi:hypothetical protein